MQLTKLRLGRGRAARPDRRSKQNRPDTSRRLRVVHVVTAAVTVGLMRRQLAFLREAGYDVTVVSAPGAELESLAESEGVRWEAVPMEREISPAQDLRSLWGLWKLMRRLRPDVVNVGTAKAGLLAGVAARLAGVPCRVYTLHGLRLETTRGLKRFLLTAAERVSCLCADQVLCVSESVRGKALELGLAPAERCTVLGEGSFNGVQAERFAPTPERLRQALELRKELGLSADTPVIGFVGRLTRDKGIPELAEAFRQVRQRHPEARLMMLGRFEEGDPVPKAVREFLESDPGVIRCGQVRGPAVHFQAMDVLALPTYREGFPTVVLEASASGKPVVATRATGAVDAVQDGVTGLLVPVGEVEALAGALMRLLDDRELAAEMGAAGRERVERHFATDRVCEELVGLYRGLMEAGRGAGSSGLEALWEEAQPSALGRFSKRALDVCAGGVGLALTGPLMAAAALAVWLDLGSPVLFRQPRIGRQGRRFSLLKLRTMSEARDEKGNLLPDPERISRLGRLLRRLSIDEFPQFWNVLKGDMSLVGPRPLLVEYFPAYTRREQLRHAVRPGLTGYAQVNGRHELMYSRRLELDAQYVERWSLGLDFRIAMRTIPKLVTPTDSVLCTSYRAVDDRGLWRYLACREGDWRGEEAGRGRRSETVSRGQHEEVLTTREASRWAEVLEEVARHDFCHLPAYSVLAEMSGHGAARMLVRREGDHVMALPVLRRKVEVPGASGAEDGWHDITSVYGYAGPIASGEGIPAEVAARFAGFVADQLREQRAVSALSRMHPLLDQMGMLDGLGEVVPVGWTLSVDLTRPEEEQRAAYRRNHRQDIRRLREMGVTCEEAGPEALEAFIGMYYETMDKVGARKEYYFGRSYFEHLLSDMPGVTHLFTCRQEGVPVAGSIFTVCRGIVQWHLSGSKGDFEGPPPTKLMFDVVRRWAMEQGAEVLHLGGGVGGQRDSLYHFKRGFTQREHVYSMWRYVPDREVYDAITRQACEAAGAWPEDGFFPLYRHPDLCRTRTGGEDA